MKKKQTYFGMMGLVLASSIGCTTILDIDHEYYDCAPRLYCGGNECVDESKDPRNCGSCGHDCQGGECRDGQCEPVVVARDQLAPTYIVVDATNIYWTNRGSSLYSLDGSVMKMPIGGGEPIAIAKDQKTPRCIAVDATHVYWTNLGDGTVMRVGIDGYSRATLATGQNNPYDIVVTDEFIFWTNEGTHPNLVDKPLLDGEIRMLARYKTHPNPGPTLDPIMLVANLNYPQGIAVDAEHVYWTDAANVWKRQINVDDRTILGNLVTTKYGFSRIKMHGTNLYWTNTDGDSVNKVSNTGSTPVQRASSPNPFGIAADATTVYWTSTEDETGTMNGTVRKVGIIEDGLPTVLASAQGAPFGIAVDATTIYWTNATDGTVMKLAK